MLVSDSWRSFSVRGLPNISTMDLSPSPLILKRTGPSVWTLSKWASGLPSWPSPPPSFLTSHRRTKKKVKRKKRNRNNGGVHRENLRKIQLLGLHPPHDDRFLRNHRQG